MVRRRKLPARKNNAGQWMVQLPPEATQTLEVLQVLPALQVPQFKVPPQPLLGVPQFAPKAAQVVGVQLETHWLEPLQVRPLPQVPQANVPPQPSLGLPQLAPSAAQVVGVQLEPPQLGLSSPKTSISQME